MQVTRLLSLKFSSLGGCFKDESIVILNGLPWKQTESILSFLRLHPSTAFQTLLLTMMASVSSKGFLPTVVDTMVI